MEDNPLKQPGRPKGAPSAFDAIILWAMVALFGIIWVVMVWFNRHPGDAMSDPISIAAPMAPADPTTQSALLGAGVAIILVGVGGGVRDSVRASKLRQAERKAAAESPLPAGQEAMVACAACGQESAASFRFCPHCGSAL